MGLLQAPAGERASEPCAGAAQAPWFGSDAFVLNAPRSIHPVGLRQGATVTSATRNWLLMLPTVLVSVLLARRECSALLGRPRTVGELRWRPMEVVTGEWSSEEPQLRRGHEARTLHLQTQYQLGLAEVRAREGARI